MAGEDAISNMLINALVFIYPKQTLVDEHQMRLSVFI